MAEGLSTERWHARLLDPQPSRRRRRPQRAARLCPRRVLAAALVASSLPIAASATTLTAGQATIAFDLATWATFGLTLNNFTGADGNALPVGPVAGEDLLDTSLDGFANPQTYTLNPPGVDVTPDPRRSAPPTSFTYDASSVATLLASASGNISLAGVSRWTVDPDLGGGQLVFGDFSLAYNGSASRWELTNNIDFPVVVFWLGSAQETVGPGDDFSVSGDLIGAPLLSALLPGAVGQDFGTFTFTTVPEPSTTAMLTLGIGVLLTARLSRRAA